MAYFSPIFPLFFLFFAYFSSYFLEFGVFVFCSWPTQSQHYDNRNATGNRTQREFDACRFYCVMNCNCLRERFENVLKNQMSRVAIPLGWQRAHFGPRAKIEKKSRKIGFGPTEKIGGKKQKKLAVSWRRLIFCCFSPICSGGPTPIFRLFFLYFGPRPKWALCQANGIANVKGIFT